jgi:class 3 adenylate cyclase
VLRAEGNATLLSGANYTLFKQRQSLQALSVPSAFSASVVFLRIQDFARRPASEQARLRAQLEAVVAITAAEFAPERRIVLDASDGAAVVVLRDPRGALRLAERALSAASAGLPLCAGLNHGTLRTAGKKGNDGVAGDGIAVAASIAQFTAPGRLFASRAFRDALADVEPGREAMLVSAGTFNDPGLRTHDLYKPEPSAVRRRARRYALTGLLFAVIFIGAGVTSRYHETADLQELLAKVRFLR